MIQRKSHGIALVVTLLVIVVLTIAVTAFMQSMSLERRTSSAYLNILKADEAVQAGFADAKRLITNFKLANPNHANGYRTIAGQMTPYMVGSPDYNADPTTHEVRLVSGNPTNTTVFDATNSVDMNLRRGSTDVYGWMGSPVASTAPRSQQALWIKMLRNNTIAEQPDQGAANYNPVVARYAYWIEDETCKLDVGVNGNSAGANYRFSRSATGGAVTDLDLSALPLLNKLPLGDDANGGAILKNITDFRSQTGFALQDGRVLNRVSPAQLDSNVADQVKFSATTFSRSDELAGTGRRRANLNRLITSSLDANIIAADLDDIGWVITGQHLFTTTAPYAGLSNGANNGLFLDQPAGTGPMTTFGSRFYSGSTHNDLYIKKIAANIRDYVDTDDQPTVIDAAGVVLSNSKPITGPSISQQNLQAIGKEAIPYVQEHAWKGLIESWADNGVTATATLRFDHYFEFFNPYTTAFTAPTGTFLKVYDFPSWTAGTFQILRPVDFEMDLSGIVFPAGGVVTVTTNDVNTTFPDPPNLIKPGSKVERRPSIPATAVRITGAQTNELISGARGFQLSGRSSSLTDYKTRFLWGTPAGLYDNFPALSISLSNTAQWVITSRGSNVGSSTRFLYSTSLRGNDKASRSGDPRSLSEQISFLDYSSSGNTDQTRWFGNISGHSDTGSPSIPGTSTFGAAAISFVNPAAAAPNNWKDYNPPLGDTAASAYAAIANTPMASIGELGHIYDPSRIVSSDPGSNIIYARGGARSLKIGQVDDLIPAARFATAGGTTTWFNAAWRLTDLFSCEDPTLAMSPASKAGKLNINGVLRDGGVALRAALRSFTFRLAPDSDPIRNGATLTPTEIDNLVAAFTTYASTNGPFMERGEISQLPIFSGAGSTNTIAGNASSTTNDRGREEIARRMMELITTRSNSFTVYAIGEALLQNPGGSFRTVSRQARRLTFQMEPRNAGLSLDAAPPASRVDAYSLKTVHEIQY